MGRPATDLFAAILGVWWVLAILGGFTLGVMWPLMAFSIMRNIKGIRGELRQLNETLGSKMTITKGGPLGL